MKLTLKALKRLMAPLVKKKKPLGFSVNAKKGRYSVGMSMDDVRMANGKGRV